MDFGVFIEAVDLLKEALLGHIILEADQRRSEAYLSAGLDLGGHIGLTASIMPDEDGY